jgi:hypothetical protein
MRLKKIFAIVLLLFVLGTVIPASAQCPLCKNSVESTLKNNGTGRKTGLGLNAGIMVLFFTPYTVAMVVGVLWYRNTRKKKNEAGFRA